MIAGRSRPVGIQFLAALLLLGGGAAMPLEARQLPLAATDSVIDRIVAVVGSKALLHSNVTERILRDQRQGRSLPTDPAVLVELRRQVLEDLINEELMVQEAARDTTIKVLEDDVTKSVDVLVRTTRRRFASEEEYRRDLHASGFETPDEYRSWLTEEQRRALNIKELMGKLTSSGKLKRVPPTEKEIRDYFEQNKSRFAKRPEGISFRQIIIAPPPKAEAKARALALADSILLELRKGADFPNAARRFSMDPGSKDAGGEIGWVRRGIALDPKFEDVAFNLRPGVVSDPVETPFGYHLIQVERTQPAEVQVRHILITPTVDSADADSAARIARNLHDAIQKGASFDSLQRIWHDKGEERDLPAYPVDSLPAAYHDAVVGVEKGKLAPVFRLEARGDPLRSKYVILLVTERIPAGDVRYEDVKEGIRDGLADQLTQQRYIEKLRRATLVEVRAE